MSHGFVFRPGTLDELMFQYIMANDEYHLPEKFERNDIVVDIGVHIGVFCYKALLRGAGKVFGFEAEPSNYGCAAKNLSRFGKRVQLQHAAVWRSDRRVETLPFTFSPDTANTGGGTVVWDWDQAGVAVPVVPFDDVVRQITQEGRKRIRLLKLDCEASEFPILLTSRQLHLVDEIAGEYHEVGGMYDQNVLKDHVRVDGYDRFTIEELTAALEKCGFLVSSKRHGETYMGLFHAVRSSALVPPRPAFLKGRVRSALRSLKLRLRSGTQAKDENP